MKILNHLAKASYVELVHCWCFINLHLIRRIIDEARLVICVAPTEWVCNHIVGEFHDLQPAEALWTCTGPLLCIRGGRYWSRPSQGSPWFNEEGLPSSLFDVYIAQHQALNASLHPTNKSQAMNSGLLESYLLLDWQAKNVPLSLFRKLVTVVPIRCGVHFNTFPTIMFVWQERFPALTTEHQVQHCFFLQSDPRP